MFEIPTLSLDTTMGQLWNRPIRTACLAAAVALQPGCTSMLKETASYNIEDFVASVTDISGTVQAVLVTGDPPAPSGGPTSTVSGIAVMINGGSSQQTLTGASNFTHVIVAVEGMRNYYDLTLPGAVASQGILLGATSDAFASKLYFNYAVGDGATTGAYARQLVRFLRVGTGDIQISVAWSDTSDVDLHVVDPNGEEISFSHKISASGGTLDLDGNAACGKNALPDGTTGFVSNENVVWPTGSAITGTYKVVLDYWSPCGTTSTDYVVTVQRRNAPPEIFTGTFVGSAAPDDSVTTFTY